MMILPHHPSLEKHLHFVLSTVEVVLATLFFNLRLIMYIGSIQYGNIDQPATDHSEDVAQLIIPESLTVTPVIKYSLHLRQ